MKLQDIIRKRPGKKFLFFVIISLVYFLLSNVPLAFNVAKKPPKTIFPYYHGGAPYDYNVYLSVITLGKNGYWLNRDAFTSENTKSGIFYFYYILVGKLAKLFNLWQPLAYHIVRIISVGLFLMAVFLVCRKIAGPFIGFWSSILALTATISPLFFFGEKEAFITYVPWWNQLEALKRLDGLPHHIFGQAMLLFSFFFIFKFLKEINFRFLAPGAILIIVTGIFFPPAMLPIAFMLPLTILFSFLLNQLQKNPGSLKNFLVNREIAGLMIFILSALVPLVISFLQTKQGHPWTVWIAWEISKWNFHEPNFNRALLFSFNLLPLTSLPAVYLAIKKNDRKILFLSLWAYMPFLLLPFVNLMGIGKIRLIASAPFIPFSVLTVLSFTRVLKSLARISLNFILIFFIIIIFLPITVTTFLREISDLKKAPVYSNIFISDYVWKTIDYIEQNVPKDSIILSNEVAGNIIAAYTPTKAYFGHINQTMNFEEKQHNVWLFLNKEFSREEAAGFIKKNNISYVYLGPEENFGKTIDYPFLVPIFQSGEAVFYKIDLTLR